MVERMSGNTTAVRPGGRLISNASRQPHRMRRTETRRNTEANETRCGAVALFERIAYSSSRGNPGLEREIALLQETIRSILTRDPGDLRLLPTALRTLASLERTDRLIRSGAFR